MISKKINIAYAATMSAGKTTCINALLGREILHSANEATTATITQVRLSQKELITCYGENKEVIEEIGFICPEIIKELNCNDKVNEILVEGDFNIDENFILTDTPGPNNSRDENHSDLAYSIILESSFDFLVYVINSTQPFINDDIIYLKFIEKNIENKKIIFLVNKLDEFDVENESIDDFKNNLKGYLNDIGFKNPIIFGVSAYRALLVKKLIYQEKLSKKEKRELFSFLEQNHDFLEYSFIPFSKETIDDVRNQNRFEFLGERFEDYKYLNEIYCKTGFPYFEFYLKNETYNLNK